ncbi:MAG: L-serine ammonia-lyase, iron-sulfur-dependent, subunit alpha [Sedimentisphaeraceae bacterium JB056]
MSTISSIYNIGTGPSSSHSMGPRKAAEIFAKNCNENIEIVAELYGSLAATGKGHLTDIAVCEGALPCKVRVIWKKEELLPHHPNGMIFKAYQGDKLFDKWQVYSIGGGRLWDGEERIKTPENTVCYNSIDAVIKECKAENKTLADYINNAEGEALKRYLAEVWAVMSDSVRRGLTCKQRVLPGGLNLIRKASGFIQDITSVGLDRDMADICGYALAVSEENAAGSVIVTAPTCGSCGVVPGVLMYFKKKGSSDPEIITALAVGGLFGAVTAQRASISGAEVGCQGEIGTACAMASAAAAYLLGGNIEQIEYAAEMGMEHFLGLTCDPVLGLVQIPCIERNAFAAMRAVECAVYATKTDGSHIVTFDQVVDVMKQTGLDMKDKYRETSLGGLASIVKRGIVF